MGNHWEHYLREITLHKLCLSLLIHVSDSVCRDEESDEWEAGSEE